MNFYPLEYDASSEGVAGPYEGIPQLLNLWKQINPIDFAPLAMAAIGPRSVFHQPMPMYRYIAEKTLKNPSNVSSDTSMPKYHQFFDEKATYSDKDRVRLENYLKANPFRWQRHPYIYPDQNKLPLGREGQYDVDQPLKILEGERFTGPGPNVDDAQLLRLLELGYGFNRYGAW